MSTFETLTMGMLEEMSDRELLLSKHYYSFNLYTIGKELERREDIAIGLSEYRKLPNSKLEIFNEVGFKEASLNELKQLAKHEKTMNKKMRTAKNKTVKVIDKSIDKPKKIGRPKKSK